ncbi:hypothetical protein [Rhizobium binae]|uniref:hypothetical protein n=1 Tax=Rhizobium binae TaxID=1138190 RepID=UPI001C8393C3|nr:hypothetical protein [Rhizobium binae]MBX4944636.1 hypothetical protein [Rhizobium binae]MBX4980667.1 hypothetical protein [Rhizobium binae]
MAKPIGEHIRVLKQENLEATRALIVSTAKSEHAKVMADPPVPQSFVRIVDGAVGAIEERVRPNGVIIYQYRRLDEIVQFAMEALYDLSPVLSGEYRNSHMLLINGVEARNLADLNSADEISIMNPLPYSRKIEVGKMQMRVAGTSKVYQSARRKIMARFGNLVSVDFTYRAFLGGVQVNQQSAGSTGQSWWLGHDGMERAASGVNESAIARDFGKTAHNARNVRFPALIIRER